MVNKTSLKFVGGFAVIIILTFTALYYLSYYFGPDQKAEVNYSNEN